MGDKLRICLVYGVAQTNQTLAYQHGWPEAFDQHPNFECSHVNLLDRRPSAIVKGAVELASGQHDAIVMLHTAFSNSPYMGRLHRLAANSSHAPKVYFIGNEYKLMPEKMTFCKRTGVSMLVTQSPSADVQALYRDHLRIEVAHVPNIGFDPGMLPPLLPMEERGIDIGYRAFDGPPYIGHQDRSLIASAAQKMARSRSLVTDISTDPAARFATDQWFAFLNNCRAQLGAEAGTDRFELTDATRLAVNEFERTNPEASFQEIHRRFFASSQGAVPLRVMSGRNVEAAAMRSIQILMAGEYNGVLVPYEHYIPVSRDLSDLEQAFDLLEDDAAVRRMTSNAHALVHDNFTYPHLIGRFERLLRAHLAGLAS